MDKLAYELTPEMLQDRLWRQVAEEIGAVNLYKLAKVIGGGTVYIPKPENILRPIRDAHIKAEFNGYNCRELARKYNVTDRTIRSLCSNSRLEGQMEIEDIMPDETL